MGRLARFIRFYTEEDDGNGGEKGVLKTVTGSLLHITDALAKPAKKFTATLSPVQDLHGYENPWPAGGGKNLLDWELVSIGGTHYGITFTKNEAEGTLTLSGTLTIDSGSVAPIQYLDYSLSGKGYVFLTEHISGDTLVALNRTYGLRTDTEKAIAIYMTGEAGKTYTETIRFSVYAPPAPAEWSPYSNICPITGHTSANVTRTGKNLLNLNRTSGSPVPTDISNTTSPRVFDTTKFYNGARSDNYYYAGYITTTIESGTVSVTLLSGNIAYGAGFPVGVIGGGTYTFSANFTNGLVSFGYYDSSWNYISSSDSSVSNVTTITVPSETAYMLVVLRSNAVGATATFTNIQLELGSTATSYEPYSGETYDITFPSEAGTVYGGTLEINEDGSGTLTVDSAIVDLGTLAWNKIATSETHWRFWAVLNAMAHYGKMLSSQYKHITPTQSYMGEIGIAAQTSGSNYLAMVSDERFSDTATFKAAMSDVQLAYELATPTEYTLSASQALTLLKGTNNIFVNNSDDLELQYYAKAEETP